jgi:hypothetical protein
VKFHAFGDLADRVPRLFNLPDSMRCSFFVNATLGKPSLVRPQAPAGLFEGHVGCDLTTRRTMSGAHGLERDAFSLFSSGGVSWV